MLDDDDIKTLVEEITWRINNLFDDFPLAGDRVIDIKNFSDDAIIERVEGLERLLRAYRKLLLMKKRIQ